MQLEDNADCIHELGYRTFVGGNDQFWDSISKLQFEFLVSEGLSPRDVLLDIACGSLRGGVRFIPYLDRGNYIGVDKFVELIIYGVAVELGVELFREKRPRFIVSEDFEFDALHARPSFVIAQSLFSHLTADDISTCLTRLKPSVANNCRFYATFFESTSEVRNPPHSHSHGPFMYTRAQMESFGRDTGWTPRYIGAWNHPRNQHIIAYHL
jgi:hypothetical protein